MKSSLQVIVPAWGSLLTYCPHQPWDKQTTFLDLTCREAFFGGAAGGGKSEALLMAALMYVHVPGYAALILRKDTQRLRLAGGLIPRSHEWLAGKAKWQDDKLCWTFATGGAAATIRFGYLQSEIDKHRYMSSEFQFIAFDELTEFHEADYLYLFSRLRRLQDCPVPLRMRAASNPGNVGHAWVKRRFIRDETASLSREAARPAYIPARIADNPSLDAASYRENLLHLPPVVREQLLNGDWSIREDGLIRPHWIREYSLDRGRYELHKPEGGHLVTLDEGSCRRFITIDPAGTSADRVRELRGRERSWSVMQVWDQPLGPHANHLLLRHQWRGQVGFDRLCAQIRALNAEWRPAKMVIEREKLGQAAVDVLSRELPLEVIGAGRQDKLARAQPLILKLERGEIWLPKYDTGFRAELEAEWFAWTGHPDEPCDQIDAAAYAVQYAGNSTILRIEQVVVW